MTKQRKEALARYDELKTMIGLFVFVFESSSFEGIGEDISGATIEKMEEVNSTLSRLKDDIDKIIEELK